MIDRRTILRGYLIALIALLAYDHNALCQDVHNESSVYINGVDVHIDGGLSNKGELENNGVISVTGDWASDGKYKGKGVVQLNGRTPQRVYHYDQAVSTLVIDGWGTKYIKGNLNISKELALKQGIVEVSSVDELTLKADAVISGGSSDSYVDGALTTDGTGYKFFPIGKNGTYAPIEFIDVKGEEPQYAVEAFENAPVISVENVIVRKALYWQRTDKRGVFTSSPVAIDYDRSYFANPDNIILLAGSGWEDQFLTINEVEQSAETDKITTQVPVSAPILLLGEVSEKWTEADFFFSTALSPHAAHVENHNVKIFGERLSADGFHLQVFDRWGQLVYENTSLEEMSDNGWDGRSFGGAQLSTGTYPYRMTARDKTGRKIDKKGIITIIH